MPEPRSDEKPWAVVEQLAEEIGSGLRAAARLQIMSRVWAISPAVLAALLDLDGSLFAHGQVAELEAARKKAASAGGGGVGVVPLHGVLMPGGGGLLAMLFGGGGLESFQADMRQAVSDEAIDVIVMDVDSPGGMVDHIPETAAQIRAARAVKPVIAVSNTQADSAAYWLASQADEVSVTPSGEAGSIGVYRLHRDLSEAHAMRGIKPTLVSAGKFKVEGNPYEALDDGAREQFQAEVDDYYGMFTADVAKGRGVAVADVKSGYGEGRALHAKQSVQAGIADRVETLQDAVRRVAHPRGRAALEDRRAAHHELEESGPAQVAYTPDERRRLLAVLAN